MHYKYQPYFYYRRYYSVSPDYYRKYYNPYYQYMQNIISSQIASVDQRMVNYGSMTNVSQDSSINQLRSPAPEPPLVEEEEEE
jgi:hypothetical protein